VQVAQELWQCYVSGAFPTRHGETFTFNMYLKMFAMDLVNGRGTLRNGPYDVILVDEAQDINPVTLQMLMSQLPQSILVLVGDKHQHIYSFNNCCNALEQASVLQAEGVGTVRHFSLSSSFRLGPAVAEVANRYECRQLASLLPGWNGDGGVIYLAGTGTSASPVSLLFSSTLG
jgi:hypothetical protein